MEPTAFVDCSDADIDEQTSEIASYPDGNNEEPPHFNLPPGISIVKSEYPVASGSKTIKNQNNEHGWEPKMPSMRPNAQVK